jgi:hypothetical protein
MAAPRLEVNDMRIGEILDDYACGHLVVPEFQREYVWKKSKAPKLLDSLYRQYPISSILLWEAGDGSVEPRRSSPPATRESTVKWLIDGQQRILTLHRIKIGEIEVLFNPEGGGQFSLKNAANEKNPNWLSVHTIWDKESYRQKIGDYSGAAAEAIDRAHRILEYKMPLVNMRDHSFKDAVEAFKRINTQGVRLRSEDIESAEIAATHSGFIAKRVLPFMKELHKDGFDRLTIMHLFRRANAYSAGGGS